MTQNVSRDGLEAEAHHGVSETSVSQPVNLLEVLDGMVFPASKMELISYAEDNGASEDVLDLMQGMPDDIYNNIHDVGMHANDIEVIEGAENLFSSEPSSDLPDESDELASGMNGSSLV